MLRFAATAITALGLSAVGAHATDVTAMTDAERTAFHAEIRAYLLSNPEVIFEAVDVFEARQAAAQANADLTLVADHSEAIFDDGFSWVGGNPDGDITLVEFLDYRCGYCRKATPEVAQLLAEDGNIKLIIKEFPILGEASMAASRFAIATRRVAGGDAYKQVHDALMGFGGDPTQVALTRIADGLGLDSAAIIAEMGNPEITNELQATRALAQQLQISGTPAFVLEDELLRGFLPAAQMARLVEEKRDSQ
jgi:protein-disulfide isomerase